MTTQKDPKSLSFDVKTWVSFFPKNDRHAFLRDMAMNLATADPSGKKHLPLFSALLDEGAEPDLFKLVKESPHENFVNALYKKRPELFGTEAALRAGVETNHEAVLRHVKTQIQTEERMRLVERNFLQWTAWCKFQGLETLERIFDVPASHDWFKGWTASEDFLTVLDRAAEAESEVWIDKVLRRVDYNVDFLCPADASNKEVRAQLERFVLMHKNKETLQNKPTPKGAL